MNNILTIIDEKYSKLSKGQKIIANFIINDLEKAAFITAGKLARKVRLSESTVVRFADTLGYDGYPQMQKAMQEHARNNLTLSQRIEISELDESDVLQKVMKSDIDNIKTTLNNIDTDEFLAIVNKMLSAKNVYVYGGRSSAPLAQFLSYYLNFILDNVHNVVAGMSDIYEQLMKLEQGDVFIAVSFPRYSTKTIDAIKFASERDATCVALTDSHFSPIAQLANHSLIAQINMASFVDSFAAPFSLVNCLIVAVSLRKKGFISQKFDELEKIWNNQNTYTNKEKK